MTQRTNRRRFLQDAAAAGLGVPFGTRQTSAAWEPVNRLPYTAAEIAGRLGISMAVFQKQRLCGRHVAAIRALGIQQIELPEEWTKLAAEFPQNFTTRYNR